MERGGAPPLGKKIIFFPPGSRALIRRFLQHHRLRHPHGRVDGSPPPPPRENLGTIKCQTRFELSMLAAHRARRNRAGSPSLLIVITTKNPVVSLRDCR